MIPVLFVGIAWNVISIFTLIRLFLETEDTLSSLIIASTSLVWTVAVRLSILVAIYISAKINDTVGCLINCLWESDS